MLAMTVWKMGNVSKFGFLHVILWSMRQEQYFGHCDFAAVTRKFHKYVYRVWLGSIDFNESFK